MANFSFRDFDLHMKKLSKNITINTKYGAIAAATVTPVVIFGSIYIACAYTWRFWKRRQAPKDSSRVLSRSMSIGVLHGGKLALERLVGHHRARADATSLEGAERDLKTYIQMGRPPFKDLQRVVAKLEMSGKEDDAVKHLQEALMHAKKQKKPHEAYEYQMLLVEMYIYKGDFRTALKFECLYEEKGTDGRRPLYKAIINGILAHHEKLTEKEKREHHEESRKCFEQFNEIRAEFEWPPHLQDNQLYEVIDNFENFDKVVQLLKTDIEETRKNQVK